jgi:hypothetical protein
MEERSGWIWRPRNSRTRSSTPVNCSPPALGRFLRNYLKPRKLCNRAGNVPAPLENLRPQVLPRAGAVSLTLADHSAAS